jgi:tubulin polyglutamylase TTLL6/13
VNDDEDDHSSGSKRSIKWLNDYLSSHKDTKHRFNQLWDKIDDLIVKTILALKGTLLVEYKSVFSKSKTLYPEHCFQILGFDVLLDSKLNPWVMEVNNHPSLLVDAPIDQTVKEGLLKDALRVISYDISPQVSNLLIVGQ